MQEYDTNTYVIDCKVVQIESPSAGEVFKMQLSVTDSKSW